MCKNPAIVIIAKRGSGKTWVCRSLLSYFRNYPVGVIISRTERTDPFFSRFFPDAFIHNKYTPQLFQNIVARQHAIREKAKQKLQEGKRIDTRLFLLMDDCLSDSKTWEKDEALKEILFNGRHLDITYVLTMQEPMGIVPSLRSNFDYVFFMYTDNYTELKKYYEHYTGMFPSLMAFKEVYDKLTENYGCMVIKKREAGRELNQKVFHFKASNISIPMIGCQQLKKYNEKNFDSNWQEKMFDNKFNINSYVKKRGFEPFEVEKIDKTGKPKFD